MLTVDTMPLNMPLLLSLFVRRVLTAKTTELFELQTLRRFLLIFGGDVVAIFAIATLQNDVVSHNFPDVRCQMSDVSHRSAPDI